MQEQNKGTGGDHEMNGRRHGPQGIDKAPGEEPLQDHVPFTHATQKGKKVDRDPSDQKDDPLDKQSI